jgi:hypothetical protein
MSETEVTHVRMQLLRDEEDNLLIDFEPPLSKEQKSAITSAHEFIDFPEAAIVFRGYHPHVGNPFTEVECTPVREALQAEELVLQERNFARGIAKVLTQHGSLVHFEDHIKPVSEGGYWFVGEPTTRRPGKE